MTFSKYLIETLSLASSNQLPISSVCNARCVFCSNKMNPFKIYREGFRPLEDIKRGICLLDPKIDEVRLSDSLPGRISEGEALLHPELFEILKLIRKHTQATIQMTTNATLLTKGMIERLIPFQPIKFTISYHSDDEKNWCKIFGLSAKEHRIAIDSFFILLKNKFYVEASMVPLPKLTGYGDIEKTIQKLKFFVKDIFIWPPGYTKISSPELKRLMNVDYGELARFLSKMRKKHGINLSFPGDPLAPIDFYPDRVMLESYYKKFNKAAWFFSEAAYKRANAALGAYNRSVPNEHRGFMVRNNTFGGNIICSGLLMVNDFRQAIKENIFRKGKKTDFDLFILPENAFNRFGDDLTLENYSRLSEEFRMEVWRR